MPEQSVYKRAVRIAGRGVDDHALRLVDDQQVGVLIHDIERYVLRLGVERYRLGQFGLDLVTGSKPVILRGGVVIHGHELVFDQPLRG